MKLKIFLFALILFSATTMAFAWTFGGNYHLSDPNFNKLAMRVYNSGSPFILTQGAYTYNAIPITTTMSGCKLISIIRRTLGFPKPAYWAIENYKICGGNIVEVINTNMASWNNLPKGIKSVINNVLAETRQYGRASGDYYGYRVIGAGQAYNGNTVYIYVLNGIKLEAMMRF